MATVYREHSKSEAALAREILKYDPERKNMSREQKALFEVLASEGNLRTETAFESTIARVGGFTQNPDNCGDDLLDGQGEVKTITLDARQTVPKKKIEQGAKQYYSYQASVSNLKNKTGPLRLAMYHAKFDRVDYFFIPANIWKDMVSKTGLLTLRYNTKTDCMGRIEPYRTDFNGLCRRI